MAKAKKSKKWFGIKPVYFIITIILVVFAIGIIIYDYVSKDYPVQEVIAYGENDLKPDENEIIVKFKDKVTSKEEEQIIAQEKLAKTDLPLNSDTKKIEVPAGVSASDFAQQLQIEYKDKIEYTELNYKAGATMVPNDPEYYRQWFLPKVDAPESWDVEMGNNDIVVAVLDTGVSSHSDVTAKYLPGFNVIDETNNVEDGYGHGTFVSSLIAAVTNNNVGIAGSAPSVKILPVKVLSDEGWGYYSWIASGITWATDHGADIINMSLGGSNSSSVMQDAINYAYSKGVVVVASAGNSGTNSPSYPANCAHTISVGATDINDSRASFSQYGSWLDMVAPGVNIFGARKGGGYGYWNGTSFSAPIVSALAGLVKANKPNFSPNEIEAVIYENVDDLGASGKDNSFGWGRVNFYKTLTGEVAQVGVGSISGRVYHKILKTPVKDASIALYIGDTNYAVTKTLSDGTYSFENIERGTYQVREATIGYTSAYQSDVYVAAGQNTGGVDFAIYSKNPVIYGKVYSRVSGKALPYTSIRLYDGDGHTVAWAKTNYYGNYVIKDVAKRGKLFMYAYKRGYFTYRTSLYIYNYYCPQMNFSLRRR